MQELLALNKEWSDSLRVKPIVRRTIPHRLPMFHKLGTSMQDNTHFFVRSPKEAGGFFTVEDAVKNVISHGRTLEEIAIEWHRMDDQKRIVEKLVRQSAGSSHPLLNLI
jgi:hypothetical protein